MKPIGLEDVFSACVPSDRYCLILPNTIAWFITRQDSQYKTTLLELMCDAPDVALAGRISS
jgi:hypothetical protein